MKVLRSWALAAALLALLVPAPLVALAASPVAPEDLFHLTYFSGALISPDGTHVLVVASKMDGPKNTYDRTIDLVDVATGAVVDATHGTQDGDYDWMPDSKSFVFVRAPEKQKPQLFSYTLADGKIAQLTHLDKGVSSPTVSHDGKHILLTITDTDPAADAYIDFAKAGFDPKDTQKKSDIRKIDQLFFESNGAGYTYDKHPHLWVVDADGSNAKQLTSGEYGEQGASWSPDDATIAFNSLRYESVDNGPNDVYFIAATGGTMHKMSSPLPANYGAFFSADGARYYLFRTDVKDSAELGAFVSAKPDGSDARVIVAKNRVSWGDSLLADMKEGGGLCAAPLPDNTHALLNVDGPGYANLRTIDLRSGTLRDLTPPKGEAWSCSVSKDGKSVAYLYSDALHPADVFVADTQTGAARQLTHVNDSYLASVQLSTPHTFTVKDRAGFNVQAWFLPALGAKPGEKRPTILNIHGGPETQFGDTFFQEFQLYASLGYNVVYADPRGSTGHGYAFEEALEHNYGDAMFEDVQAVMDTVVKRPDVDASRLAVLGGSYGGYATLWVVGHTNRYKTAIAERVVSNLMTENLGADFAGKNGLGGGYYGWGIPWSPASTAYAKMSPITYVGNVRTPLMILHSDDDTRTPLDQTLQEFTALKILGRPVEYVAVPNETHDLSRTGSPIHRVERLHLIMEWLARHL